MSQIINYLKDMYDEWQFNRQFTKKKKQLMKMDPFIYETPEDKKNTQKPD